MQGALGAMDGTLIPAAVRVDHQSAFRSRKGTISQNVLAICDFNLMFTYVYAGWEGSASDAHVLSNAIISDQHFPWPNEGTIQDPSKMVMFHKLHVAKSNA